MNRRVIGRVLLVVLTLGLVGAAVFGGYQAGFDQGLLSGADGDLVVSTGRYIVGPGYGAGLGAFLVFGFFFKLLFFILLFGLIFRLAFGRRRWAHHGPGGHGGRGPWGHMGEGRKEWMEQRLTDWHSRAHGEGDATDTADARPGDET